MVIPGVSTSEIVTGLAGSARTLGAPLTAAMAMNASNAPRRIDRGIVVTLILLDEDRR